MQVKLPPKRKVVQLVLLPPRRPFVPPPPPPDLLTMRVCRRLLLRQSTYDIESAVCGLSKDMLRKKLGRLLNRIRHGMHHAYSVQAVLELPLQISRIREEEQLCRYLVQILDELINQLQEP